MKRVIWGLGQGCQRHWKLMLEAQAARKDLQLEAFLGNWWQTHLLRCRAACKAVLKAVSKTFPVLVAFECFQQSQVLCAFFVKTQGWTGFYFSVLLQIEIIHIYISYIFMVKRVVLMGNSSSVFSQVCEYPTLWWKYRHSLEWENLPIFKLPLAWELKLLKGLQESHPAWSPCADCAWP